MQIAPTYAHVNERGSNLPPLGDRKPTNNTSQTDESGKSTAEEKKAPAEKKQIAFPSVAERIKALSDKNRSAAPTRRGRISRQKRPGSTRYHLACRHWPAMTIMGCSNAVS